MCHFRKYSSSSSSSSSYNKYIDTYMFPTRQKCLGRLGKRRDNPCVPRPVVVVVDIVVCRMMMVLETMVYYCCVLAVVASY
jgi:hypothetical protein